MQVRVSAVDPARVSVDALVIPFVPKRMRRSRANRLPLAGILEPEAAAFAVPELDAVTWVSTRQAKAPRAMLVSLGKPAKLSELHGGPCGSPTTQTRAVERRHAHIALGARIWRTSEAAQLRSVAVYVGEAVELGAAILEGWLIRAAGRDDASPKKITIACDAAKLDALRQACTRAQVAAEANAMARVVADMPPNSGSPEAIVEHVRPLALEVGLELQAFGRDEIQREGLRLVEAVDRGARNPAQILWLEHNADRRDELPTLVLIGKGVTMDAGGYDLKRHGIYEMNYDKAGAAAVIGAAIACAQAQVDVHLVAVCPFAENLVGRDAVQPGEIIEAHDETRVFIENTDAEGRLLIADLLSWVPTRLGETTADLTVDIATLTGTAHNALGEPFSALFCNDDGARDALLRCGERSDERLWPMPIHELHDRELAHPRADLKNVGASTGAASAAAAFLRYFTSGPWAHIDMGGKGHFAYERDVTPAGATGYGARLLLELARSLARGEANDDHEGEGHS